MISKPDFEKKQILFVFATSGERVSFSNDNIVIKDKEGKIKHQSTCYRIFVIFIIGEVSITSGLIQRAHKFGFTICLMNRSMRVYGIVGPRLEGNTLLHEKQYEYDDIGVGRHIVRNKIANQRRALLTIRARSASANNAIEKLCDYGNRVSNERLSLQEILGIEGLAARIYFNEMYKNYDWHGRKPRIKRDFINTTLDIGYTILFNIVEAMLGIYGFDLYRGVLHRTFYMRKSLVCDLVEPFRPIVDLQVRKSINLGQCKEEDFDKYNERFLLKWKENPRYVSFLCKPLIDMKSEMYDYFQMYYRSVMKGKEAGEYPTFDLV